MTRTNPPSNASPLAKVAFIGTGIAVTVTALGVFVVMRTPGPSDVASASPAEVTPGTMTGPDAAPIASPSPEALRRSTSASATPTPTVTPTWIWTSADPGPDDVAFLHRRVEIDPSPRRVTMSFSGDNETIVRVDGREVGRADRWDRPGLVDLTRALASGVAEVTVEVRNHGGDAGFLAVIDVESREGARRRVVTDGSWQVADDATLASLRPATERGPYGMAPWGELTGLLPGGIDRHIAAPDGFVVELIYEVPRERGSWVSLAVDDRGRLIASGQTEGLHRVTPSPFGADPSRSRVQELPVPIGAAQGLAWVDGELFCVVSGQRAAGPGLYRVRDGQGNDRLDEWTQLRRFTGGGEHGPHAVIEGPDGQLYVVGGNHTALPDPERSTVPRVWAEDHLLPRLWDANGHAVGILAPGGWICRTDREGKTWELLAIGFRNPYDIAFDRNGELFTYDADMEWDMGAPWYRPTRVNHVVSGAEFGWRSGSGKWPTHYPDSLPAVVDIGPGSPTGVLFGTGARFPLRYQRALYLLDWTFGTIYAVHLTPDGASFTGIAEPFVTGRPLPVTDAVISPTDGAMYFIVGGRGTPSAVYRVRYEGPETVDEDAGGPSAEAIARRQRRDLESFHDPDAPASAVVEAWPYLAREDRFLRYAARIAIEHQPVERWRDLALDEPDDRARLAALLALTRVDEGASQTALLRALGEMSWTDLDEALRLEWLRVLSLGLIRLDAAPPATVEPFRVMLADAYPSGDEDVDRELCDLLVYLESPVVVGRTIALMERTDDAPAMPADVSLLGRNDTYGRVILEMATASPQRQQVHYALALRNAEHGWTPELRERYFRWFGTARRTTGGNSFTGFLDRIRAEALERVPEDERDRYTRIGTADDPLVSGLPLAQGPGRQWTVDGIVALARNGLEHRNFENGQRMYAAASCIRCHRFAGTGRVGGPDLTAVATRFTLRDLAEALVEPSRTVSDQYRQTEFVLDDGTVLIGRAVDDDGKTVRIMSTPLAPDALTEVPITRIAARHPSEVSPMMPALLDPLGPEEVLDLLAYLLAEGDPRSPVY